MARQKSWITIRKIDVHLKLALRKQLDDPSEFGENILHRDNILGLYGAIISRENQERDSTIETSYPLSGIMLCLGDDLLL